MILVAAYATCDVEHRETIRQLGVASAARTRLEEGCEDYRFFEEVSAPGNFVWVEQWRDEEMLRAHYDCENSQLFRKNAAGIWHSVSQVTARVYH